MDFVHDWLLTKRKLKCLTIVDDFTKESIGILVGHSISGAEVAMHLASLDRRPKLLRSDNGPEFRSEALQSWAKDKGIRWDFIQPGCPAQNAYIERFNGTYRLEVLDANQFHSLDQARTVTEEWLAVYNEQRTHSAIGHLPPLAFKRRWQLREFPEMNGLG